MSRRPRPEGGGRCAVGADRPGCRRTTFWSTICQLNDQAHAGRGCQPLDVQGSQAPTGFVRSARGSARRTSTRPSRSPNLEHRLRAGGRAGRTVPSARANSLPCQGQTTQPPAISPSDSGPPRCVQRSSRATIVSPRRVTSSGTPSTTSCVAPAVGRSASEPASVQSGAAAGRRWCRRRRLGHTRDVRRANPRPRALRRRRATGRRPSSCCRGGGPASSARRRERGVGEQGVHETDPPFGARRRRPVARPGHARRHRGEAAQTDQAARAVGIPGCVEHRRRYPRADRDRDQYRVQRCPSGVPLSVSSTGPLRNTLRATVPILSASGSSASARSIRSATSPAGAVCACPSSRCRSRAFRPSDPAVPGGPGSQTGGRPWDAWGNDQL